IHDVDIISIMSKKLASLLSLSQEKINGIAYFSKLHVEKSVSFNPNSEMSEDEKFESLRLQTELGSELISRYQLISKCENIVRAALEGYDTDEFIANQREIQNNIESQIILLCELYVTMRSVKSYKRAYNHSKAIAFMENQCKIYFDPLVFDRFIRFSSDFESIYDEM
ncbi:MAG: hypothetical protein IJA65_02825, partial [Acholeplasmatales bacterium]|nr:hypothetical protein [Acholeplasmatales bacterium]